MKVNARLPFASVLLFACAAGVQAVPSAHAAPRQDRSGTLTEARHEYLSRGYLVRDPRAYAAAKAAADRRAPTLDRTPEMGAATVATAATRPSVSSWEGAQDAANATPSDSTGAIGPTRYVEMINLKMAVYSRAHTLLMLTSLFGLTGDPFLTDPQIIWDPDTGRFYYLTLDDSILFGQPDTVDFRFGFSSDGSPTSLSDWCNYSIDASYGSGANTLLPDQPHLGDSNDFVFWGANVFDVGRPRAPFVGADAVWITKPPPGSTCPAANTLTQGKATNLLNADFTKTSTPVGVNQTDSNPTGWLIGSEDPTVGPANALTLFRVTKNPDGSANVKRTGTAVSVGAFGVPADAIQGGISGHRLDTIDGRLTQAVSGRDPSRGGRLAIWTQHTVFGGAGAAVRWYEINPIGPGIFQRGTISNRNLFVFNAAISPDRRNDGAHAPKFGASMGIGFTTTSRRTDSTIWVASKVRTNPVSPWRLVKQSPGPEVDDSCSPCRWGDFMGASPDPAADPTGDHGAVWMSSQWNAKSTNVHNNDWRTQNWRMRFVANSSSCTMIGTAAPDVLVGSNAHDVLCGKGGSDSLFGERGNDALLGGAGRDVLNGGPGTDRCISGGGGDTKVSCER